MSLKEQLLNDMKTAMRDKDILRKNAVQMVRAAVLQIEKDKQVTLSDPEIVEVIAKEVKKRRDAIPDYQRGGREDLVENLKAEIAALEGYLPEQLSEAELKTLVAEAIAQTGAASMCDMGKVMGYLMPKVSGRADGKQINQLVKNLLSE